MASAAQPGGAEELQPPGGFKLHGSHGYTLTVLFYLDGESAGGKVALTASRGNEFVSYTAPAEVTPDSIHAGIGSLGRVDLVLHRSGDEKTVNLKCLHHRETFEGGTYEGVFEFDGEKGFTQARATRVAGQPALALYAVGSGCGGQSSGESLDPGVPGARLAGISFADDRTLNFKFNKNRPTGKTLFAASLSERRDGIRIYRQLAGVLPPRASPADHRRPEACVSGTHGRADRARYPRQPRPRPVDQTRRRQHLRRLLTPAHDRAVSIDVEGYPGAIASKTGPRERTMETETGKQLLGSRLAGAAS
jgi:hypothetical protein